MLMSDLIATTALKETLSRLMMDIFSRRQDKKEVDITDRIVDVWADDNHGQLNLSIQIPTFRTEHMQKNINNIWIKKTESIFKDIAGGCYSSSVDGNKSYNGKENKEKDANYFLQI